MADEALERRSPPPPPEGSPGPLSFDDDLRQQCQTRLDRFERTELADEDRRRAAVAICVLADPADAACFLLTQRASTLRAHGGQYALPGGSLDPGETPAEAALRELSEEVGIEVGPDAVLGVLDDYPTRSGFVIVPVVVWVPGRPILRVDPAEVADTFLIGLHELGRPDSPRLVAIPESPNPMIQLPNSVTVLHAPTAAVVHQFGEVCLEGRQTPVAHMEAPVWAWK